MPRPRTREYCIRMFAPLRLIYPVVSRRSGGLSLGVDLFPDRKTCNFDCPYCEIFPFPGEPPFRPEDLDRELAEFFEVEYPAFPPDLPLRDLTLSGSGEPTLSPHLESALALIRASRDRYVPGADLVVITNSTTLGHPETAALLGRYVDEAGLRIWAKVDGGNEDRYRTMSRSPVPFREVVEGILSFSRDHGVIIQTMLCALDGRGPSEGDLSDYADLLASLLHRGARFLEIHLYTQARPSPEGRTSPIGDRELLTASDLVSRRIPGVPIRIFGRAGELSR